MTKVQQFILDYLKEHPQAFVSYDTVSHNKKLWTGGASHERKVVTRIITATWWEIKPYLQPIHSPYGPSIEWYRLKEAQP